MREALLGIMHWLRLTRVSKGFAAIANLWFVILWTRAEASEAVRAMGRPVAEGPLPMLLGGAVLAGAGLYAFGAVLNDLTDLHRDRARRADRPIAAGQVTAQLGAVALAVSLIAAVLGSTAFGTLGVQITLLLALAVIIFNVAGKFVPAVGIVLLGGIYAGQMFTPNPELSFIWPVWLVTTHAAAVAAISHALERKSPRISGRAITVAAIGWVLLSLVLARIGLTRDPGSRWWPAGVGPLSALAPAALALSFFIVAIRRIRMVGPGQRAAEKIGRYGALWLPLYGIAWLVGEGHFTQALILAGLTLVALVGMTLLREVYGLVEQPIGFRRA